MYLSLPRRRKAASEAELLNRTLRRGDSKRLIVLHVEYAWHAPQVGDRLFIGYRADHPNARHFIGNLDACGTEPVRHVGGGIAIDR